MGVRRVLFLVIGIPAIAGILALASLLYLMRREHGQSLELPKPGGLFAVGRTSLHWVYEPTAESTTASQASRHDLMIWIWYPADVGGTAAKYLPPSWQKAFERTGGPLMAGILTRDLGKVLVHSSQNVPITATPAKFPVVMLRAGAEALSATYSTLAEDLASRGYVVVAFDAAYRTTVIVLPDGTVIARPRAQDLGQLPLAERITTATGLVEAWTADAKFVVTQLARLNAADPVDRFTGRLDLDKLGIVGHSMGGATSAQFCHDDSRCKAGVNLDGRLFGPVIKEGLKQPFMFVLEDVKQTHDPGATEILSQIDSMYAQLPTDTRLRLYLQGANHFTFTDQIVLKSQWLLSILRRVGVIGDLDGPGGLRITGDVVSAFFDVYLKGDPKAVLDTVLRANPELHPLPESH